LLKHNLSAFILFSSYFAKREISNSSKFIAILVLLTIVMKDLFKQMAEESATSKALSE